MHVPARTSAPLLFLLAGLVAVAAWSADAVRAQDDDGDAPPHASGLTVVKGPYHSPEVVILKSNPVQFNLSLVRNMRTEGWELEATDVDVDPETRTIRVRIHEKKPDGFVPQVITAETVRMNLGALRAGRWLLVLEVRRDGDDHVLTQAMVLHAAD